MTTRKQKKALMIAGITVLSLAFLMAASFLPTLWLENGGMSKMQGTWVNVYYETQENAAKEVFELAEERAQRLTEELGITGREFINIYIYDSQFTFQTKKYGLIGPMLGLDWYIGDNRGTNVLLTSPANPGRVHGYEECRDAGLHEMVHAYNSVLNPKMQLWLNEGVALYLSGGAPPSDWYASGKPPSLEDIQTGDPVKFSNIGGYYYAYTYVEYLDKTYGWDKVLALLRGADCGTVFQASEKDLYTGWLDYLKSNCSI